LPAQKLRCAHGIHGFEVGDGFHGLGGGGRQHSPAPADEERAAQAGREQGSQVSSSAAQNRRLTGV
jgi:hypothetical protein